MPMPKVGDPAPAFSLMDQSGRQHDLATYAGKQVVLYFYPKDDTPGCTVEACNFRDEHSALEAAGAVVLGVSPDDAASHEKFANKFNLNFPLLADTDHATAEAYGVWGEKSLYGRKFMGVTRATFLIGPDGRVARVWPKVQVDGHVAEVRAALDGAPAPADAAAAPAPAALSSMKAQAEAAVRQAVSKVKALAAKAKKPAKAAVKPAKRPVAKAKAKVKAKASAPKRPVKPAKKAPAAKRPAAKKAAPARRPAVKKGSVGKKPAVQRRATSRRR